MDMEFITWQAHQHPPSGSMHGCPSEPPAPAGGDKQHWGDDPSMFGVLDDLIAEDLAALNDQQPASGFSDSSAFDLAGAASAVVAAPEAAAAGQCELPAQQYQQQQYQQHYQQPTEVHRMAHQADLYSMAASGCAASQAWFGSSAQPMAAEAGCGAAAGAPPGHGPFQLACTGPQPDLVAAGSPTSSSVMTAGFSSAGCSSSGNLAVAKRRRSEDLDEDYRALMGPGSAAAGNSKAKPKQQRISWQRHMQELQHLEQQVTSLTTTNDELHKKVRSLNDAKAELLARLMTLTEKWRGTVEANDQLQRRELAHERTIATLERELATLRQQWQQTAGPQAST